MRKVLIGVMCLFLMSVGGPGRVGAGPFLTCDTPDPTEQILYYNVYQDATQVGALIVAETDGSLKMDLDGIVPGSYVYTIEAVNAWGASAPSNPYTAPTVATVPVGVTIKAE